MLRGALATPTRTDDAAGVLIVGSVLTLVSWIVTPLWLVVSGLDPRFLALAPVALGPALVTRGYFVRVVGGGVRSGNAAGAPSFVRWGVLYRDGVKSAVLSGLYLLPLVALAALGVAAGAFVELGRVDPDRLLDTAVEGGTVGGVAATDAVIGALGGFVGLLAVAYIVLFAYLRPAALARFAESGRLRDGFHPGVFRVAVSGEYAAGWTLAMVVLFTGYALAAPFVPLIAGVGLVFATRLVVHALYGRGAADALGYDHVGSERSRTTGRETDATPTTTAAAESPARVADASPKPAAPEAEPAVQAGRTVPLTGTDILSRAAATEADRVADDGAAVDAPDDADDDAPFDWGPTVEERDATTE